VSPPEDATRAAYDAVAQEYEKQLADELDGKPLDRALLAAFAEMVGPGIVADVGCGPGHVAAQLRALGRELIGVDLSPSMIEIARERYPAIDFQVGSMLDLPAGDGAWAGAVLMYSIIHLPVWASVHPGLISAATDWAHRKPSCCACRKPSTSSGFSIRPFN